MKVAVTGATGIVGRFVCERLAELGHEVRGLHRRDSDLQGYVSAPQWVQGHMADDGALIELLNGVDAVVHCAFSHVPGRYRGGEGENLEKFLQENLGGTLRLLQVAQRVDVARVVLLSSRAVFGRRRWDEDPHTHVADEHPLWPDSYYGALKAAEEALASATNGLTACALRPTGVYGLTFPVERSKWFDLAKDVVHGKAITEARSATEVHGKDVADAISCLLTAPEHRVHGRGFNCSDLLVTTRRLVAAVAERAGCDAALPEEGPQVINPMRCDGLHALGWRPGGEAQLKQTLDALVEQVLASS